MEQSTKSAVLLMSTGGSSSESVSVYWACVLSVCCQHHVTSSSYLLRCPQLSGHLRLCQRHFCDSGEREGISEVTAAHSLFYRDTDAHLLDVKGLQRVQQSADRCQLCLSVSVITAVAVHMSQTPKTPTATNKIAACDWCSMGDTDF